MSYIPQGYLSKAGRRWRPVKLIDIVTLLYHVHVGARSEAVGFEDADRTLEQLTKQLNRTIPLDPALLESALWSCNLLQEQGQFTDHKGRTFEEFLRDLLGNAAEFHKVYNCFKEKK